MNHAYNRAFPDPICLHFRQAAYASVSVSFLLRGKI
jgi:hypothetical protein